MKSKKGFTLIELLAVIVILAIIALIATPIVLNLIEKARKGAAKASVMSYIRAVETYLVTSEIDVTLEKLNANTEYDVSKINALVELKGTKPTSGKVTISDKSTVATAEIVVNGYTVKYDGKDYEVKGKENNNSQPMVYGATYVSPSAIDTHKGIVYLDPTDLTNKCNSSNSTSETEKKMDV